MAGDDLLDDDAVAKALAWAADAFGWPPAIGAAPGGYLSPTGTSRFAGYRLDDLARAFVLYEYELTDAFASWAGGDRKGGSHLAVAAALNLGRRLGIRLIDTPLVNLEGAFRDLRDKNRLADWLAPQNIGGTSIASERKRYIQSVAVGVLYALRANGCRSKEAADRVASAMTEAGYRHGAGKQKLKGGTITTLMKYRKERLPAEYEDIWSGRRIPLAEQKYGVNPTNEQLLELLRHIVRAG